MAIYFGSDASGSGNNWQAFNLSTTQGVTYDSMVDSPTNVFTSATDIGGVVSGNYCTLNPLFKGANLTLSNANLTVNNSTTESAHRTQAATMGMTTGKWYWEVAANNSANVDICGVISDDFILENYVGGSGSSAGWGYSTANGSYYPGAGWSSSGTAPVHPSSGTIMVAFDADAKKMWFGKQGTWNTAAGGVGDPGAGTNPTFTYTGTRTLFLPAVSMYANTGSWTFNFGQRQFLYTPPTGFKSLNTTNLQERGASTVGKAAITPNKWMDTNLYGGTGATQTVTNSGFQPDFMWSKARNTARSWRVIDSVRGSRIEYYTDATNGDATDGSTVQFQSNGFTIDNSTGSQYNTAGDNYVSYQWKQSPSSGFNIISYTGNGASSRTITHNLGVAPKFIITKRRETSNWWVYHDGVQTVYPGEWLYLNVDYAHQNTANAVDAPYFKTAPTSSVFSIAGDGINTSGGTYMSYVWAEVPGFSKIGTYYGNGSSTDGPFVYTGFKPAFILTKNITTGGYWWELVDNKRSPLNPSNKTIYGNRTETEFTSAVYNKDLLSNGFKPRGNSAGHNSSGDYFAFVAFAESPFALNNRAE